LGEISSGKGTSLPLPLFSSSLTRRIHIERRQSRLGCGLLSIGEKEQIRETVRIFFLAQETGDEKLFLKVWHPEARRFGFGSNNELYILDTEDILANQFHAIRQAKKRNSDFSVTYLITRIKHIDVQKDNLIASASVEWQMLSMGKSIGVHYSQFQFVKSENDWAIVNVTDRGKDL
jgi:hypothetical protein